MKKTRMISVIAASLLTATVVFTGCGGGGASVSSSSSSSVSSSSSSSVSSSSSSSVSTKKVIVSDGYVLGAAVNCGNNNAVAIAPGKYEFSVSSCAVNMNAANGYIDVDDNGKITKGEPKAPNMQAPKSYSNINPFTTFLAKGVSVEDLQEATGLNAVKYNYYDISTMDADAEFAKKAVLFAAAIKYIEEGSVVSSSSQSSSSSISSSSSSVSTGGVLPSGPRSVQVRGVLPSGPGGTASSVSSSSAASESSSSSTQAPLTYVKFIERLKNGESVCDIIPALEDLKNALDSVGAEEFAQDRNIFDKKAKDILGSEYGACEDDVCVDLSSSSEANSSSSTPTTSCLPGTTCSSSSETNSSSSAPTTSSSTSSSVSSTSSSSSSSVSSTKTGSVLPAGPGA